MNIDNQLRALAAIAGMCVGPTQSGGVAVWLDPAKHGQVASEFENRFPSQSDAERYLNGRLGVRAVRS